MKKNYLDFVGLQLYDGEIKEEIKKKIEKISYFIGTQEEYNTACSNGTIRENMLIILTDDNEE